MRLGVAPTAILIAWASLPGCGSSSSDGLFGGTTNLARGTGGNSSHESTTGGASGAQPMMRDASDAGGTPTRPGADAALEAGGQGPGALDGGPTARGGRDGNGGDSAGDGGTMDGGWAGDGGVMNGGSGGDADGSGISNGGSVVVPDRCDEFTACGGDLTGTWNFAGVCIAEPDLFDTLTTTCPSATIEAGGELSGTVQFDAGTVQVNSNLTLEAVIHQPFLCSGAQCGAVEATYRVWFEEVECESAGNGGCICKARQSTDTVTSEAFRTSGNTVHIGTPERSYNYCVDGDRLTYKETSTSLLGLPAATQGTYSLVRD